MLFLLLCQYQVASLAEAWIETLYRGHLLTSVRSPPSRRRGLKLRFFGVEDFPFVSPPSRRRGLKPAVTVNRVAAMSRLPRGGVD